MQLLISSPRLVRSSRFSCLYALVAKPSRTEIPTAANANWADQPVIDMTVNSVGLIQIVDSNKLVGIGFLLIPYSWRFKVCSKPRKHEGWIMSRQKTRECCTSRGDFDARFRPQWERRERNLRPGESELLTLEVALLQRELYRALSECDTTVRACTKGHEGIHPSDLMGFSSCLMATSA